MTYLQLVNGVLRRLREEEISTVISAEDEVAKIVIDLVNDSKTKVENAWNWNALRTDWDLTMVPDQSRYTLTDSSTYVAVTEGSNETKGYWLDKSTPSDLKRKAWGNTTAAYPLLYAVSGASTGRDVEIEVWPKPLHADAVKITGYKNQPDLVNDDDVLRVPHLPVLYEALAMAARERGEVGGQTAVEIFGVAKKYLEDAVALDGGLSPLDNIWYSV